MLHTLAVLQCLFVTEEIIGLIDITNPFGKLPSGVIRILKLGVKLSNINSDGRKNGKKGKRQKQFLALLKILWNTVC